MCALVGVAGERGGVPDILLVKLSAVDDGRRSSSCLVLYTALGRQGKSDRGRGSGRYSRFDDILGLFWLYELIDTGLAFTGTGWTYGKGRYSFGCVMAGTEALRTFLSACFAPLKECVNQETWETWGSHARGSVTMDWDCVEWAQEWALEWQCGISRSRTEEG